MTVRSRHGSAAMATRTRRRISACSHTWSGAGGSEGTSTGGRLAPSTASAGASGDVSSIVLIRTMVRPSCVSSVPRCFARSESDGSQPRSCRSFSRAVSISRRMRRTPRGQASRRRASIIAPRTPTFGEGLELDASRLVEAMRCVNQPDHAVPERGRSGRWSAASRTRAAGRGPRRKEARRRSVLVEWRLRCSCPCPRNEQPQCQPVGAAHRAVPARIGRVVNP